MFCKIFRNTFFYRTPPEAASAITPIPNKDWFDIVIIHAGCIGTNRNNVDDFNVKDIPKQLITSAKKYKSYGVKWVIISSILVKKQMKLSRIIRQVFIHLHEECERNNFLFVNNDDITREYLWRDGLHLNNNGTLIFGGNLVGFLNNFVFDRNTWQTEDNIDENKYKFNINDNIIIIRIIRVAKKILVILLIFKNAKQIFFQTWR